MRKFRPHTRLLLAAALSAAAFLAVPAPAPAASASVCASASDAPGEASTRQLVGATLCLLNDQRSARGMRGLRLNGRLSRAAHRHALDMARRNYFSHDSLGGSSFVDRIRSTGYLRSANSWLVGENLAWGSGDRSTPQAIVRSWMDSPGHRTNILNRRYREIGIGVAFGSPTGYRTGAATYATDFGSRG
jgi:uncharacterized protein YkwD